MSKFARPNAYDGRKASKNKRGQVRAATTAEAEALVKDDVFISPSTLSSAIDDAVPDASLTVKGKVELATAAEMSAGVDTGRVPAVNVAYDYINSVAIAGAPTASETQEGIAELATTAEAQAGTDDARIMTAAKVVDLLETPPAIGGTTPAAGTFTDLTASESIALDGDAAASFSTSAGDITIDSNAGSVIIDGGEAVVDAILLDASNAAGGIDVDAGTGGITIDSGDTISIDAAAASNFSTSAGDLTLQAAAASVNVIGNENDAECVLIEADGGISERVHIHSDQGTGADSIFLDSDVGGITLSSGLATADALNLVAASGGLDVDVAGQMNLTSSQNAADAVRINASAGGIDIDAAGAAGEDISIVNSAGSIFIQGKENDAACVVIEADGGTSEKVHLHADQGTGVDSIFLESDVGGLTLSSGLASADAINLSASAGGVDVDGALQVNIASSQNAADAIRINASAGGIDIDAAGAAAEDISIVNAAGSIFIQGGEDEAACVLIEADGGISERVHLHADQGTGNDSIFLESDVGGVTLTSGKADAAAIDVNVASGGMAVDAGLGISLDAAGASNFSTSGAGIDLDLASAAGRVIVTAGEDAADCIYLHADAGSGEKIRIHADQGTGADSVELASDVGGVTLSSGLASADAINLSASAGGVDIDGALEVNIASSRAATGALTLAVSNAAANITLTGAVACTPDSITSDNGGTAASVNTVVTLVTTDGDSNEDSVTIADGLVAGQIKIISVIAAGNAADSVKFVPANFSQGTKITFSADPTGKGASFLWDGSNWNVYSNNGGTIA